MVVEFSVSLYFFSMVGLVEFGCGGGGGCVWIIILVIEFFPLLLLSSFTNVRSFVC